MSRAGTSGGVKVAKSAVSIPPLHEGEENEILPRGKYTYVNGDSCLIKDAAGNLTCRRVFEDIDELVEKIRPYADGNPNFHKLIHGDSERAAKIENFMSQIEDIKARELSDADMVPRVDFEVSGSWVDVGRYISGEPECMGNFYPVETATKGRIIHIAANVGAKTMEGIDGQIELRGAAVAVLCTTLQRLGFSVELSICDADCPRGVRGEKLHGADTVTDINYFRGDGYTLHTYSYRVVFKRAGDMLDMDRLAFCLCDKGMPWLYDGYKKEDTTKRGIWGLILLSEPSEVQRYIKGDGVSSAVGLDTVHDTKVYLGDVDRIGNLNTPELALGWVREKLKQLGAIED